jgi:adenylate cyclase
LLAQLLPRAEAPQVLLVEDLHFADPGSETFLQLLCRQVGATSTLLLLNFRPDYADSWLQQQPHRCIRIGALDHTQVEAVAGELLGGDSSVAELAEELARCAAGNPFYVEEAVQALAETGYLQGGTGGYRLAKPLAHWPIPDTVHGLVAARVDQLEETDKALLQAGAIIGLEFSLPTLARLSELPQERCAESLAALQRRGFVAPKAGATDVYAFCHPVSQDVVYHAQLETRRNAAHRRLAGLLVQEQAADAASGEASAAIAYHWRRAGEWLNAAEWNLRAARWSSNHGAGAMLAQFRLAQKNLAQVPQSTASDRLRTQALAGVVRMAQFTDLAAGEVEHAYVEARALAEANHDTAALAELLIAYASEQLHRGDARRAVEVAAEAVRLAVDSDARELIHRFRVPLLLVHSTAGYPREGVELVNEAGGSGWLTEPISAENFMSRAFYGLTLGWLGRLDEAHAQVRAALAYAEQINQAASWMHTNSIDLAGFSGDYSGVLQHGQLALQLAESWGSSYFRAIALRGFGLAHVLQGDAATAVNLLEQALPLVALGANGHQFQAHTLSTLARAYGRMGAVERAWEMACAAIAGARASHSRVWEINCWLAYFELPQEGAWAGRIGEGLARVDELIEATGAEGTRPWWWLARAKWAADPSERADCHSRALEAFTRIGAHGHVRRLTAKAC